MTSGAVRAIPQLGRAALAAAALGLVAAWVWAPDPAPLDGDAAGTLAVPAPAMPARLQQEPLQPLPAPPVLDAGKVALGEALFADRRLSDDDSLACAGCHDLAHGGADRTAVSRGVRGAAGQMNAPSVFNVSLHLAWFWDGRAATLEQQVAGPVHNPVEMASNWAQVLGKLRQDGALVARFAAHYPQGLTAETVADALATFERSLITPDARFDRYLRGAADALSADEIEGYERFKRNGCASCHNGAAVGGNMFQRFGVVGSFFDGRVARTADLGRLNVTGREEDRHVFKVPSLRNVALTAPYFHDGSATTLEQAVRLMGRHQIGRELTDDDVRLIVAFLHTLTGRWKGHELK